MKRWDTHDDLLPENYFDDIAKVKPRKWSSMESLSSRKQEESPLMKKLRLQVPENRDLICDICDKKITVPKLLPCLHTFCKKCIEFISKDSKTHIINKIAECPICKSQNTLPFWGVDELPANFLLTSKLDSLALKDLHKEAITCENCEDKGQAIGRCMDCAEFICLDCQKAHKRVRVTREHTVLILSEIQLDKNENLLHAAKFCAQHVQEELKYFCETCSIPICRECTFSTHPKEDHSFKTLEEAAKEQRLSIASFLENVRRKVPFLRRTALEISQNLNNIPSHVDAIAKEIKKSTEKYTKALQEREVRLLEELEILRESKVSILKKQKEKVERKIVMFESSCSFAEKALKQGNDIEIARVRKQVLERMEKLDQMKTDMEPEESPEFEFETNDAILTEMIQASGEVDSIALTSLARAMGDGLYTATVGKTAYFSLIVCKDKKVSDGNVDVRIETPDGIILTSQVIYHNNGSYSVSYRPKVHGEHAIFIAVKGHVIPESPFVVPVKKGHMSFTSRSQPVCLRFGTKGQRRGEMDSPSDVTVNSSGQLITTDTKNHRIQVFDGRGNFLFHFGLLGKRPGKFQTPTGLTITHDGHIVVADQGNRRIQFFSPRGLFLQSFDVGEVDDDLTLPTGIAIDEEGQILVSDQLNHKVLIFTPQGSLVHKFGSFGSGVGQFNTPHHIAVNHDGQIFVADSKNHRVQVFDHAGKYCTAIGREGNSDGEFNEPTGIAIDASGYIFVSDKNNTVQVFNQHYKYITKFGAKQSGDGQLNQPHGLDYTPEGRLVVMDTGHHCGKIFYYSHDLWS